MKSSLSQDAEKDQMKIEERNVTSEARPLEIFQMDIPTQLQVISAYLTLSSTEEGNTPVVHPQYFTRHYVPLEEQILEYKGKDEDFDPDIQPKRKTPFIYKGKSKLKKNQAPHNTHAQIFTKLLRCFKKLKNIFPVSKKVFEMKPNKREGLELILHDPALFEVLAHIFSTGMLMEQVEKAKALKPQKEENIKQAIKLKAQFEQIYKVQATIFQLPLQLTK